VPPGGSPACSTAGCQTRCREDRDVRAICDVFVDVHPQLLKDGFGDRHQLGAMGLGVPFDESTPVLGDGTLDRQPAEVVEVASA